MVYRFARLLSVVLLVMVCTAPRLAWAHGAIESGNYKFEIGWMTEPVIVGQPNGLELFITPKDSAEGVADVEATLYFKVDYGGVSRTYDLQPVEGAPGHYISPFIPTRVGQYTFALNGTINGEAVSVKTEPEEVTTAGKFAFPEEMPATTDLATRLETATAQAAAAQVIGIVGIVVGLIGVGIGVFALMRKK